MHLLSTPHTQAPHKKYFPKQVYLFTTLPLKLDWLLRAIACPLLPAVAQNLLLSLFFSASLPHGTNARCCPLTLGNNLSICSHLCLTRTTSCCSSPPLSWGSFSPLGRHQRLLTLTLQRLKKEDPEYSHTHSQQRLKTAYNNVIVTIEVKKKEKKKGIIYRFCIAIISCGIR